MRIRLLAVLAALCVSVAWVGSADAQRRGGGGGSPQGNLLELGRSQYDDLRYEEAIQTLSAAIIRRGNAPAQEIQIYELLGLSYLALNRTDEAEGAFRQVLIRDQTHSLSNDLPPRFVTFFNAARQRWEGEGRPGLPTQGGGGTQVIVTGGGTPVAIEHRSPPQQNRNTPVRLTASLGDPGSRVARVVLAYRAGSRGLFTRVTANRDVNTGNLAATIPASSVRPPFVEYYFEAVDSSGVPVQSRGDAFAPLRISVPEAGGVPWPVFVIGGVVVAAAVIIPVVIVTTSGQPGTLNVSVQGD